MAPGSSRTVRRAGTGALAVVVLLTLIGLGGGLATKAACLSSVRTPDGAVSIDWNDYRQYRDYCYSDTIPLYGLERLADGGFPYKTAWVDPGGGELRYMEYPVVTGLLQYGVMRVTKAWLVATGQAENPDPPEVVVYFLIMALVLAAAWLAAVLATRPLLEKPWHIALVALSPLVVVHAFTNFDTLAVALAMGGLLAWARGRPGWAGLLLGLGAAAKLYPLLLLGPLLVLCWRDHRMRAWREAALSTLAGWLVVNGPIAVLYPRGWWEFFRLNSTRAADHDSVYNAISVLTGWPGFDGPLAAGQSPRILNAVSLGLFLLLCLAIGALGFLAKQRPPLAALTFLTVAAFLLTNKVWSPQYSLWLVPLAVLALPKVVPLLAWMSFDAYLWYPRLQYFLGLAEPGQGTTPEHFVTVVLIRDGLVLLLCALVVARIVRGRYPERDPAEG
ncbi:glycosyltransferase family 87 protein [Spongisporangium articulatum]|uniref:Glycosyltransferase family 87 protein n=1 Tax=Spongisporangium articulatum TaxID=3362603 RepID=A0ABW8AMM4_9ACTN